MFLLYVFSIMASVGVQTDLGKFSFDVADVQRYFPLVRSKTKSHRCHSYPSCFPRPKNLQLWTRFASTFCPTTATPTRACTTSRSMGMLLSQLHRKNSMFRDCHLHPLLKPRPTTTMLSIDKVREQLKICGLDAKNKTSVK